MEDHLIFVAAVGGVWELASLVSVQGARHVEYYADNVVMQFVSLGFIVLHVFGLCKFGGTDTLALAANVALLGILGLGGGIIDVLDVDEGPGEVVSSADGLKPCALRQ